jgi:DNA polymerase-3 subunit gamma/tau
VDGYRALYRTWRPHRFADVVGQEHVTRTLRNAIAAGRLHHAYLFCGPRGTGKTSVARILAQAVNCLAPRDGEPCGECANCTAIAADRFLDLQEIDGATNRGIDEVRGLREDARYAAINGRAKVYIIDEVHMLTEPAWNALLKTLEEPPAGTVFILATTDPRKIPLTALSRCQRFDFHRLTEEQIAARLRQVCAGEGLAVDGSALAAVARRAEGGLRDALSLLDQGLAYAGPALTAADVAGIAGAADEEALARILAAVPSGDAATVMAEVERLYVNGRDFAQVARDLAGLLRDRLVALLAPGRGEPAAAAGSALAGWTDRARCLAAIDTLAAAEADMRRSGQPRFVLEVALLRLMAGSVGAGQASGAPEAAAPRAGVRVAAGEIAAAATPAPAAGLRAASPPPPGRSDRSGSGEAGVAAGPATPPPPAARRAAAAPRAPAPRPEANPPAGAAPDPGGQGEDLLAQIVARWPEILDRIKPSLRPFLRGARPVAAARRRLTLRVTGSYDLLQRRVPDVASALAAVLGGTWGVDLVAEGPEGAAATPELAAQMFDGEVIEPAAGRRRGGGDVPF